MTDSEVSEKGRELVAEARSEACDNDLRYGQMYDCAHRDALLEYIATLEQKAGEHEQASGKALLRIMSGIPVKFSPYLPYGAIWMNSKHATDAGMVVEGEIVSETSCDREAP